jgi:rfaE bifunctional protein kinase chain/domain/rfaE bifunctional protein nucleotidyltransferase chain/domain
VSLKILPLKELSEVLQDARVGKKVVHCHGCFDLLHIGHIRHFTEAKSLGDLLVVTVTPDCFVNKGPGRPVFKEYLRLEAIASLDCVDYVALNETQTAEEALEALKPNVYCKGAEYKNSQPGDNDYISIERAIVERHGGTMAFTTDDVVFSSSNLINDFLPIFSPEVTNFLKEFKEEYPIESIIKTVDSFKDLKVLVVGESILDEYHYVTTMGKSMKEPILASKLMGEEKHAGGTLAIANHMASFSENVELLTLLGDHQAQEAFVKNSLNKSIKPHFFYKKDSPTIVKRRFVEKELLQKLFEVYEINEALIEGRREAKIIHWLEDNLKNFDMVVVADYGHGMMTPGIIKVLCERAPYLCVNAQGNAGNQGHNPISKYFKADCISVAQHELVLEFRSHHMKPEEMVESIAERLDYQNIILTRGKYGTMCYRRGESIVEVPAIAPKIVDRVGAGDAVLSLISMALYRGVSMEVAGFIGNAAGAEAVAIVGNKSSLQKKPFIKHLESLLK